MSGWMSAPIRQDEWRSEMLRAGIRGKGGQMIHFSRVEPFSGTRWLHADAETKGDKPQRAVISFGPEHAPLEQKQVEMALEEARKLVPRPQLAMPPSPASAFSSAGGISTADNSNRRLEQAEI